MKEVREGETVARLGREASWKALNDLLPKALAVHEEALAIEKDRIGAVNFEKEKLRLAGKRLEREGDHVGNRGRRPRGARTAELEAEYDRLLGELAGGARAGDDASSSSRRRRAGEGAPARPGREGRPPERDGTLREVGRYAANVWAFVSEDPRESNTEGGIFPAIFGTVLMVLLMSLVVTPLGVLTAFYLREYAKQGPSSAPSGSR